MATVGLDDGRIRLIMILMAYAVIQDPDDFASNM